MTGLEDVTQRIKSACQRSGRDEADVMLVAVSKGHPAASVRSIYDAGHRVFGESRAQELAAKYAELDPDVDWHFIGPLQRNKVRVVRPAVSLLHSLDRIELAEAWMKGPGQAPNVLLQVRMGDEASKHGFVPEDLSAALDQCRRLGVPVVGLMTIPPPPAAPDWNRSWFAKLREARDRLNDRELVHLSMGMSDDFEIAIEEGATIIRVGTAIFGERQPAR